MHFRGRPKTAPPDGPEQGGYGMPLRAVALPSEH